MLENLQTRVRIKQPNHDDKCFHSYSLFKSILTEYNREFDLNHLKKGSIIKINESRFTVEELHFILYSHMANPTLVGMDYMAVEDPLAYNSELVLEVKLL